MTDAGESKTHSDTALPSADVHDRPLVTVTFEVGTQLFRAVRREHQGSLGFGKGPSRFSDPRDHFPPEDRFGVIYASREPAACFLETLVRDHRAYPLFLPKARVRGFRCAHLAVRQPLVFVDLRADGPVRMRVPTDAKAWTRHHVSRPWAHAFHEHPLGLDGICYPCRHNETLTNIAIFDRALKKAGEPTLDVLAEDWEGYEPLILDLLRRYTIRLLPAADTAADDHE